jgi:outer membrane protein assembly factor BamE (lipoprotein component of BamABCDE complex)
MSTRQFAGQAWRLLGIGALVVVVTACASRVENRGNLPDPQLLAEIKPGEASREQVAQVLGSPSSVAVFDQETWYYISEKTEAVAFFEPEVRVRNVVIVRFDTKGMVKKVETLGLAQGNEIEPVDRITPTAGREFTVMEQLIGNLGRFNKKQGGN